MAHAEHDAHHAHGPDHVPHITPLPVYLKTFGTLLFLTAVTVGASYVDLGTSVNLAIAILIATVKASVVAAFFMHLASDHKFHTVVFGSSLVFLIIFIAFTMFDTTARGGFDPIKKERPAIMNDPFAVPSATAPAPLLPGAATATAAAPAPLPSASAPASASAAPSASEAAPAPSASESAPAPSASGAAPAPSASAAP